MNTDPENDQPLVPTEDVKILLNAISQAVWEVDAKGNAFSDSASWRAFTGQSVEEWKLKGWLAMIHPEDYASVFHQWQLALHSLTTLNVEARVRMATGGWQWSSLRLVPIKSGEGAVQKWVGALLDLPARQEADHKSAEKYRLLFNSLEQGFCIIEVLFDEAGEPNDYRFLETNRAFDRQTGLDNAIGKTIRELAPNHEKHWFEIYGKIALTGEPARFEEAAEALGHYYEVYAFRIGEPHQHQVAVLFNDIMDQVLARRHMDEIQQQVLLSFEQSPVGIAIIDKTNLTFKMANPFYMELVGRELEELVDKPLLEALPEIKGQGFDKLLEGVINTGVPFIAKEVSVDLVRNKQLETIYVDLAYQPRRNTSLETIGVLVIATDVTQQVRSRQSIEASEARLRDIIATAPAAMGLFVGRDLVVEMPNQAFIDIVGKGSDIVGKPLREVMPELENQPYLQILDDVYTSGKMYQSFGTQVNIVQAGVMTYNYYNITYTPLTDEQGQVYAILDIAIDVTDAIRARQEVEQAESRLRGAVELAQLGTWELDVATGVVSYSDRIKSWFGFSKDEMGYSEVYNPIHAEDQPRIDAAIKAALEPGSAGIYDAEYRLVNRRTGAERIIHAQGKTYFDEAGRPVRLNGTAQDITSQRQIQHALEWQVQQRTEELAATNEELAATNEELAATNEELTESNHLLVHSNQNLEQFAYVASHDLQEPLRKIQSFGDILKNQYAEQLGEGALHLNRMQAAASRMSTLIRDLLAFSRLSTRQNTIRRVDLNEVITTIVNDLELTIEESGAVLEIGRLPSVQGDKSQLGQLFLNLLSNALKFRHSEGKPLIQLKAQTVSASQLPASVKPSRKTETYHQIDITDNGIGFDEKYADRIFQVFQRLHGKNQYAGTGIGLAISQKVVTNHGGFITARSELGQGATFSVYLPI